MYDKLPAELKQYNNWVCWQAVLSPTADDPNHIGKRPICAKTGDFASSTNPDTWCDFDTAVKASEHYSGIGFVFTNTPYFGVDLDKLGEAIEDYQNGNTQNIIGEFVYCLRSYAELSQSGKGIHIICKGSLPARGRRSGNVEMYETGRFFTMSGNVFADYPISECTDSIKPLHEKYIGGGIEPQTAETPTVQPYSALNVDIQDRLSKLRRSKQGSLFDSLMSGDIKNYGSQSEADLALCNILAFWLDRSAEAIDSVFRTSGLMRTKWDRKQSGTTYGALTIQKAIEDCSEIYGDKRPRADNYIITIGQNGEACVNDEDGEEVKQYTMDDTGNAERMFDNFGDRLLYSFKSKQWYYWDKRRWCIDETGTVKRVADASLEIMQRETDIYRKLDEADGNISVNKKTGEPEDGELTKAFKKHIRATRSSKSKNAMVTELQHRVPVLPGVFDRNKYLFNTPSGIIDLNKNQLLPHDREKYITKIAGTELSDADCPNWKAFLNTIFCGDVTLIRYIQKSIGYSLSGSTSEQCVFFLHGNGSNGKSTFLEIIRSMLGDYCANAQIESFMVSHKSSGNASSDIARLKGARIVTANEPNEGMRLDEGLIKQLTGGDIVTARFQYASEFEFTPEFKLWIATNHKPIIRGTDTGIWRRIHLIPFLAQIPDDKKDRSLPQKLKSELPAILRWAVDGYTLYRQEGLRMPAAVKQAVAEYRGEMGVISSFISACCVVGRGSESSTFLYSVYRKWANDNNEYVMSHTKFTTELLKKDGIKREIKRDGKFITGITVQDFYRYQ